jgi:hypothetical protein
MRHVVRQELFYNDNSVQNILAERLVEGMFVFMKHDFQTSFYYRQGWGRSVPRMLQSDSDHLTNDDGFPQMVPGKPRIGVRMDYGIQWFIVKQFVLSRYGIMLTGDIERGFKSVLSTTQQTFIKEAFRQAFRDDTAFTNHSGIYNKRTGWSGKSFIHNTGGPSLPRIWENSCGGSTHRVNQKLITDDMDWIEVATLDPAKFHEWREYNFIDNREYFVFATNSTPYLVGTRNTLTKTGPWKVDPMHMLGGAHVPLPLMSAGGKLQFERRRVEIMYNMTEFRTPYNQ